MCSPFLTALVGARRRVLLPTPEDFLDTGFNLGAGVIPTPSLGHEPVVPRVGMPNVGPDRQRDDIRFEPFRRR